MKPNLSLAIISSMLLFFACSKTTTKPDISISKPTRDINLSDYALMGLDSPFLSVDSANVMINSYLNSISSRPNDLKSLIVDADALRYYLQNTDIKHVKLMFAHKLSYIRSGNGDDYSGLDYGALTIVIAGFSSNNNYIYSPQGAVMDFCLPCPASCPTSGTAQYHTLPSN